MQASELVGEFWSRIQARDWDGLAELLAEDFTVDWPNAGLRIRGRDAFVEFNRSYPEGWSIERLGLVAEGATVACEVRVPHPTVGPHYLVAIYEIEDGRLARGREYWVEERREQPTPERARWFESM